MEHPSANTSSDTIQAPAKRKLRNFLIDKGFQLRWMFRVIVTISVIVTIMGYFLYQTVADATDQLLAQKVGDMAELTEDSFEAFYAQAQRDKQMAIYKLVLWLVSLVAFVSFATIALTHRIAGPIHRMRKIFADISGDNLCLWERLRKGDDLKEAFEDFDDMLRRLREHRREDTKILEVIRDTVSKFDACDDVLSELDALIERYKESVKMS